jgi:hypothetical protein
MLLDSVIIRLSRHGAGVGPSYKLIILGQGTVIYEGKENVKLKGRFETSLDKEKFIEILSKLKDVEFFSLRDSYPLMDRAETPSTVISISLPKDGKLVTKSVKYYPGDRSVPGKLKNLGEKIDSIVGTNRWIGDLKERETFPSRAPIAKEVEPPVVKIERPLSATSMKRRNKLFAISGVIVIMVALILLLAFYFQIFSLPSYNGGTPIDIEAPEFIVSTVASNIRGYGDYDQQEIFEQGDSIFIYLEYSDIKTAENGNVVDIQIVTTISSHGDIVYTANYGETDILEYKPIEIATDGSWPIGDYKLDLTLTDNLAEKSASTTINFYLSTMTFRITKLVSASEVRGYEDYDEKLTFNAGDTFYIYQEYGGYAVDDDNNCDLYLELYIEKSSGGKNYSDVHYEYNAHKKEHHWEINTDDTWPYGIYIITAYIKDNIADNFASETCEFDII